ncbi:MAG: hypothetical protein IPM30_00795 [Burkholderiales bacterium]|nr:hypothetical protein [Burkholderiales bacterium]
MAPKHWLAVLCLVAGVPLAAWGLANGSLLTGLAGLALVFGFLGLVFQWMAGAGKPMGAEGKIKPAANAAWSMKDQPANQHSKEK